ncbi:GNAT family N-acetyltransferase [Algoriphagus sp. AK58]|uniref:GNAT family N-acetyltransferase n=1 Tax=Algoriphagus sp. AK58 TaxID=1406877 RepID=UPI00164FFA6F|nr:GNAT family N-acetyltransferase [Algoriphagus sp. AK58]MBC6368371.1 GNAT family N-acetyltransferase [Algoriphagus sp. AK58]
MEFQTFTPQLPLSNLQKEQIADFLVEQLEEFGDPKRDVLKCLDYAMNSNGPGGLVILACESGELIGGLVLNHTGMSGYIPEHILVYFAVKKDKRGKGLGKKMLQHLLSQTQGAIALHVEPQNPAKKFYEEFGFSNKYLEMRLSRD